MAQDEVRIGQLTLQRSPPQLRQNPRPISAHVEIREPPAADAQSVLRDPHHMCVRNHGNTRAALALKTRIESSVHTPESVRDDLDVATTQGGGRGCLWT